MREKITNVHNNHEDYDSMVYGEGLDEATVLELGLTYKVATKFSDFVKRHQNFVNGTITILAGSALIIAARAIERRRKQGIKDPGEISDSISSGSLGAIARSSFLSISRRIQRKQTRLEKNV